jgi:hypothetical protein
MSRCLLHNLRNPDLVDRGSGGSWCLTWLSITSLRQGLAVDSHSDQAHGINLECFADANDYSKPWLAPSTLQERRIGPVEVGQLRKLLLCDASARAGCPQHRSERLCELPVRHGTHGDTFAVAWSNSS